MDAALGGLGGRIRARARGQGLHKLDMKRRRLRAERLIGLAVRPKSRRDGHRHLIGARGQHRRRVAAAAALAAPIVEPMLANPWPLPRWPPAPRSQTICDTSQEVMAQ